MVSTTEPPPVKVCIIGAGPSGLVALKTFKEQTAHNYYCVLLEAEAAIGGTFRYRGYENAQLVSSKQLTCFSDFRLPRDHPDHIELPEYCNYLQAYADHFNLNDHINLNCRVYAVRRDGAKHRVSWKDAVEADHEAAFDKIIICSGLHVTPSIPEIRGIEHIPERIHSSAYKSRKQITGKNVLILGCGETAMDIAYEAIKSDCPQVVISQRGGFLSIPKVLNRFSVLGFTTKAKLPIDGLITNLFETHYVHPWIAASRLRWKVSDHILQYVLWFLTGTKAGCNQYAGDLPSDRLGRSYVFLNKSTRAMPYINRPYKRRSKILDRITRYIDPPEDVNDKIIELAPWTCHVESDGEVKFQRGTPQQATIRARIKSIKVKPDIAIYCTGYTQSFPFLQSTYPTPETAHQRGILGDDESIAFIGFMRPGIGAIPPISEMQSLWLATKWSTGMKVDEGHYSLLHPSNARIQYGVDHGAYISTLARDFGGQPEPIELLFEYGWKVCLAYCFGASFTTFYRLLGPHALRHDLAKGIVEGELSEIIRRRGILGNFFFAFVPMVFYFYVNLFAWSLEKVSRMMGIDKVMTSLLPTAPH